MKDLIADLISANLSKTIELDFINANSKNVVLTTKAYYVYFDLKCGILLNSISENRLFFLYKYLLDYNTKNMKIGYKDMQAIELFHILDNKLNKINLINK